MLSYHYLSIEEQTDLIVTAIYFNSKTICWSDFSLKTDKIIQIICDYNDDARIVYYLDDYANQMYIEMDYENCLKLTKKRMEYFNCYGLTERYQLGSFSSMHREELLRIVLQNIQKNNIIYVADLSIFNLSFINTINIAFEYPKSAGSILYYLKKFTSINYYKLKKDIILKILINTNLIIREEDCLFLKEDDRIEILNALIEVNPQQVVNNIEVLKISDPLIRLEMLIKIADHHPDILDVFDDFLSFDLSSMPGVLGKLFKELENISSIGADLDFALIRSDVVKSRILNNNDIWNDNSKEIWEKELNFLIKYEVTDEFSAYKFFLITNWLLYTIMLFNLKNGIEKVKNHVDIMQKILKEIRSFSDTKMRFVLSKLIIENICEQSNMYDLYCEFVKNKNQTALLPSLVIISNINYNNQELNYKNLIEEILNEIYKKNKKYKDGKHFRPLISGLQSIFCQSKLQVHDKFLLTNKVLSNDFANQKNYWWLIQAILMPVIINNPRFQIFYNVMQNDINLAFKEICIDIFQIDYEKTNNYEQSFAHKHNRASLLLYYAKMQLLPENEKAAMLEVLYKYVNSILTTNSKEYYVLRYSEKFNPHLQVIFSHYPCLKDKWQEGYCENYKKFIEDNELTNNNKDFDLMKFLITRCINHQHLPLSYRKYFEKYIELTDIPESHEENCKEIEEKLEQLIILTSKDNVAHPDLISYKVQLALIKAVKNNPKDLKNQIACLMEINRNIPSSANFEFVNDLYTVIRKLMQKYNKESNCVGWNIVDTDDYWSMFMLGTDVDGSCQRVDGDPNLNKCLMGYVMNGDYRMLAIQNEQGITIARSIIHLLWDPCEEKACIFIEEPYPFYITNMQEAALYRLAMKRAAYLGLNLMDLEGNDESINYHNPLIRIAGGHAPWIYSDANYKEQANGKFKITNAKVLYNHSQAIYLQKKQELDNASLKYEVNIYQKGIFFSASKYANEAQPYGPYADRWCFSEDPITKLTEECTMLLMKF